MSQDKEGGKDRDLDISPEQLEVVRNLSSSLAEGQRALMKLLAGQSLNDLSTSERQVAEKLLKSEESVEAPNQPISTTISSETAQVVRSTQDTTRQEKTKPDAKEQLSVQERQITQAWQKAFEVGKEAALAKKKFLSQMSSEELDQLKGQLIDKFKEELGSDKEIMWLLGGTIACIPCTDNEDVEWYVVFHPTNANTLTSKQSKFFRLADENDRIDYGKENSNQFEIVKPAKIYRGAQFNPRKDNIYHVELCSSGEVIRRRA